MHPKTGRRDGAQITTDKVPSGTMQTIFAAMFGGLLGLSLLKFGNPIILEQAIESPTNVFQWVFWSWPVVIGYWLLAATVVAGLFVIRWKLPAPRAIVLLPLMWLIWELLSGTQTIARERTVATLVHFATCVVCFYLGLFSLGGTRTLRPFWIGLLTGLFFVLAMGFDQRFGGLEQTRQLLQEAYPDAEQINPDLMKRMATGRIFATLFYPNTLAGVILLLFPVTMAVICFMRVEMTKAARLFLVVLFGGAQLACLYWTGSKGGWLLMLLMILVAAMFMPFKRQLKLALVASILILGLTGFSVKYAGFFKKGATSVVARFDYWQGALKAVKEKPLLGSGAGTFGFTYQRLKRPEAEATRLAHNDYLQQASDSGVPGFLLYAVLVICPLVYSFRRGGLREDWVKLAVWLGVLGWALQSLVEFNLYIPATAWLAFTFMGWLLGQSSKASTGTGQGTNIQPAK